MDGAVHTYKARLVAKGFTQTLGIDYKETFSSVADIRAIRILIAIATFYDYEIWQMDVKIAFLNRYLSKEVYMEQPKDVKSYLGRCFAMKDLGEAAYILGIKIYRDRSKQLIGLCQSAYIGKILKIYYMENSKHGSIPMQEKLKLIKSQGASTPAENITSRFQQNPGKLHWTAVKNILKYLRNTEDMILVYRGVIKQELRVFCYTDAGYMTDADDLKSQTGYVFVLNECVVDWKSTKQRIFATSSAEAKYIAASDASKEAVLGITQPSFTTLHKVIEFGDVKIEKVHTNDNLADPFTKVLAFPKYSDDTKNIDNENPINNENLKKDEVNAKDDNENPINNESLEKDEVNANDDNENIINNENPVEENYESPQNCYVDGVNHNIFDVRVWDDLDSNLKEFMWGHNLGHEDLVDHGFNEIPLGDVTSQLLGEALWLYRSEVPVRDFLFGLSCHSNVGDDCWESRFDETK
ncbi:retrotransposon protein, putative, ty1-copia subclass [Tanacetum coccineum]